MRLLSFGIVDRRYTLYILISMKYHDWDEDKNKKLIEERGISFEMCMVLAEKDKILVKVQNKAPYGHQQVYVLSIDDYIYLVPFVEDNEKIFLKTIIPSRKATKKYIADKEII